MSATSSIPVGELPTKQPRALSVLFFAELWERFSYYGMRCLLIYYMTEELLFSDEKAYGIYGAYTALLYTTPLIGGLLADKILGYNRAIILGAITIALGHLTLACHELEFEGFLSGWRDLTHFSPFNIGLALIICGTGLFKSNVSSFLGKFYEPNDLRRDSGFTIFYMGINLGCFSAPLVCGYLGETYGWSYGFGVAAVGMIIGLITYLFSTHKLEGKGDSPRPELMEKGFGKLVYVLFYASISLFVLAISEYTVMDVLMPLVAGVCIIYLAYIAFNSTSSERVNLLVILILAVFHLAFFACYQQVGNSMALFVRRVVDRDILFSDGSLWEVPATWFQAVDPFFIILLGPLFSMLWMRMGRKGKNPSTPLKFVFALVAIGAAFLLLSESTSFVNPDTHKISMIWPTLAVILFVVGELCISPIGLSMVSALAPKKDAAAVMGIWMFSHAYAYYVASVIARLMAIAPGEDQVTDPGAIHVYGEVFEQIGYIAVGVSVVLLIISPMMRSVFRRTS